MSKYDDDDGEMFCNQEKYISICARVGTFICNKALKYFFFDFKVLVVFNS